MDRKFLKSFSCLTRNINPDAGFEALISALSNLTLHLPPHVRDSQLYFSTCLMHSRVICNFDYVLLHSTNNSSWKGLDTHSAQTLQRNDDTSFCFTCLNAGI
jgi:hypothetical protein